MLINDNDDYYTALKDFPIINLSLCYKLKLIKLLLLFVYDSKQININQVIKYFYPTSKIEDITIKLYILLCYSYKENIIKEILTELKEIFINQEDIKIFIQFVINSINDYNISYHIKRYLIFPIYAFILHNETLFATDINYIIDNSHEDINVFKNYIDDIINFIISIYHLVNKRVNDEEETITEEIILDYIKFITKDFLKYEQHDFKKYKVVRNKFINLVEQIINNFKQDYNKNELKILNHLINFQYLKLEMIHDEYKICIDEQLKQQLTRHQNNNILNKTI